MKDIWLLMTEEDSWLSMDWNKCLICHLSLFGAIQISFICSSAKLTNSVIIPLEYLTVNFVRFLFHRGLSHMAHNRTLAVHAVVNFFDNWIWLKCDTECHDKNRYRVCIQFVSVDLKWTWDVITYSFITLKLPKQKFNTYFWYQSSPFGMGTCERLMWRHQLCLFEQFLSY